MERQPSPKGTSSGQDASASSRRFQCLECQQTFGRVEHLTRHSRSHMKERYLKCPVCRKGFYRIDALRRHEQTHKEPKRSALAKGSRACIPCAAARRKCSGEAICAGCQKRSLECKYPDRPRRAASDHLSPTDTGMGSPNPIETQLVTEQTMANAGDSPMSWSQGPGSPKMGPNHQHNQTSPQGQTAMNDHIQGSPTFTTASYANPFTHQGLRMQAPSSPGLPGLSLHSPQSKRPAHEGQSQIDGAQEPTMVQSLLQGTQQNRSMAAQMNLNIDSANASTPWFQSNFSSINWLPENWTPDFQIENGDALGTFDQDPPLMFENNVQPGVSRIGTTSDNLDSRQPKRRKNNPRIPIAAQILDGQDLSSPSSQSTHSGGHYYIDGDGARLPRVRKAPYRHSDAYTHSFLLDHRNTYPTFTFPELDEYQDDSNTSNSSIESIPTNVYSEIFRIFNLTCVSSNSYPNFQGGSFPSLQMLSRFVQQYTQDFWSILPFMHPSSFDLSTSHWLLILAMATIGSHYNDTSGAEVITLALHEFLRRAVLTVVEMGGNSKPDLLVLTQVKLLSCVGMMYSGDERLKAIAKCNHSGLVSYCDRDWRRLSECPRLSSESADHDWKIWCQAESSKRTGYCIWLLDCMWAFHFQMRPLLSLDDAKLPIPCQEVLWEAESALDWQQLYACATSSPSLHSAIQLAYIEKRIQSSTGEFSRILCVHALFRRTWEVENYFKQPLTLWTPTAEKQDISTIERSTPVWLPGIPTYAKWRNSACDCLDILHWHANSVIGAASGMEHPTVLHLHLARVILLTPYRQILQLAQLMSSELQPSDELDITSLRKHIQRWVVEDQHKARLAMIHAGVLFWHVRRYSADGFYEPSSVLLATLALWAYGSFAPPTSGCTAPRDGESPQAEDDDAESLFPTSMQLDRPADDELVQLFVKRGASMRANITGVGNLCSSKGPVRVLVEGRNLLVGLKTWGYSRQALRTLGALIEVLRPEGTS